MATLSYNEFLDKIKSITPAEENSGDEIKYELVIPNIEVKSCYKSVILECFNKYKEVVDKKKLFEALLNRDAKTFSEEITTLLQKSISYHDNKESFYYGLVLGLLNVGAYYMMLSQTANPVTEDTTLCFIRRTDLKMQ